MRHENACDLGPVLLGRSWTFADRVEHSGYRAGKFWVCAVDRGVDDGDHDATAPRPTVRFVEPKFFAGILGRALRRCLFLARPIIVVGLDELHVRVGAHRLKHRFQRTVAGETQAHDGAIDKRDEQPRIGVEIVLARDTGRDLAGAVGGDKNENLLGAMRAVRGQGGDRRRNVLRRRGRPQRWAAASRSRRPLSRRRKSCPCGPDRTDIPCRQGRYPRRSRCNSAMRRRCLRDNAHARVCGSWAKFRSSPSRRSSPQACRGNWAISRSCPKDRAGRWSCNRATCPLCLADNVGRWSCSRAICRSCPWGICAIPCACSSARSPWCPWGRPSE